MSAKSETRDFLWFLAKLAVFVFVLRSFIVSPFNIPSESMQPRLLIGDYLLVAKWPYGYSHYSLPFNLPLIPGRVLASTPQRGDVVVFKAPPTQKIDYIKRVIGLPGDMISVRGGTVYLNGQAIRKQRVADLVIPVSPNMVDAAAKEGSPSPVTARSSRKMQRAAGVSAVIRNIVRHCPAAKATTSSISCRTAPPTTATRCWCPRAICS